MSDDKVPVDYVARNASNVVFAALRWRASLPEDPRLGEAEWRLWDACNQYGSQFVGIRAR